VTQLRYYIHAHAQLETSYLKLAINTKQVFISN